MYSAKKALYDYINIMRHDFKLFHYPVNVVSLCENSERIDLIYHSFKTSEVCAHSIPGDKHDTIILNTNRNYLEQNFDCAHEMIHLTKHRSEGHNFFHIGTSKAQQDSFQEWEANEGAAELLMPHYLFLQLVKRTFIYPKSDAEILNLKLDLAERFRVSPMMISVRMESLKYEIAQYNNGVKMEEINFFSKKQLLRYNINVKSLNDIQNELIRKRRRERAISSKKQTIQNPVDTLNDRNLVKLELEWLYGGI